MAGEHGSYPVTHLTLEEFLASPRADAEPSWEYLPGGRLVRKVSPSSGHSIVQLYLGYLLLKHLEEQGIDGEVMTEVRVTLPDASPVPDLAFYAGRLQLDADGQLPKYPSGPPQLAVEVMSPGQTRRDMLDRCRLFVDGGSDLALLVDPVARQIVAVTAGTVDTLRGEDPLPLDHIAELAALRLTVDDVFARLPRRT